MAGESTTEGLLTAIHKLELSLVTKLTDFQSDYRQRIADLERRFILDLQEHAQKTDEKLVQLREQINEKTDGQRAKTVNSFTVPIVMFLINLACGAAYILLKR